MPIQSAIAQVGAAKQTAKGTPGANPTFAHGITDGAVVTVEVAQELESRTSGKRFAPDVNRTGVMPGIDFTCRAHARATGLWLFGAMGATSVTGSDAPYTHTVVTGADLPYLTAFGKLGDKIIGVNDLKVDTCEISWSENEPVEMSVTGMGCATNVAATFTPGTDDSYAAYMRPAGGTFKVAATGTTPTAANITGGSVSINNGLTPIMLSGAIQPSDVFPGQQSVEVSLEVTPDNLDLWQTILTSTGSGTTVSAAPIYGSFEIQFTDGTSTLQLEAERVAFTTDFPSADAGGGPVTLSLAGLVVLDGSQDTMKATLVNTVAAY
jgi:hypothetical protein